ncbi:MAG: PSD1 domain-containing protein [Planctomycetia bacterium]|nr:PSD1 domain-containing protein [Planctomycetia bacterium]
MPPPVSRPIDFGRDIRPLLARHCYACHGPDAQEGGLRLDQKAAAAAGGQSGPEFTPGKSADSRLVRFVAGANDEQIVMPPEGGRLAAEEIGLLRAWIDQGAVWPEAAPGSAAASGHWAFLRPVRPPVPAVKNGAWVRNEIDAFVLAKLESQNIEPSPEADRPTLIRRLSLDLTGLPPSPEEVAHFVADRDPDAYEHLVDRLLASPHFGERWARHWLDLARYADSSGYEFDAPRSMWRYRDWVINAVNRDLPFHQFVIEQIAGDVLGGATVDQTIASGFHCNAMLDPNLRWEAVLDQVNTTGTVFLGLTVGCAQCHNHKFDPLSQREYFALYAFFDSASINEFELATTAEKTARDAAQGRVDALMKRRSEYEATLRESLAAWESGLSVEDRGKLPPPARAAISTTSGERSADQISKLVAVRAAGDSQHQAMSREIDERSKEVPKLPSTLAMRTEPRETRLFVRGNPDRPGDAIAPGVPAFLHPLAKVERPTRLDLARWLVAPENPLVARVTVNRWWQSYFGLGLVETANDFGVQTPPPLHQPLLDWLATEFMARGWSAKEIHQLIVCSATYRQSSRARPELDAVDPNNRLLARQRRLRVEAEVIRDLSLTAGGLLATKLGGPSVFPYQAEGVLDDRATKASWTISPGEDRYRRGLYTWTWRLTPHPMLALFDAPDASMACTRRDRSNTPVQALTLLNDPTFVECARGLARRLLEHPADDDRKRLVRVFRICLGRLPQPDESDVLLELLQEQLSQLTANGDEARRIAGRDLARDADIVQHAAWTVVCRALLSLDEFVTRE